MLVLLIDAQPYGAVFVESDPAVRKGQILTAQPEIHGTMRHHLERKIG
jgi:hypothetical protein